MAHSDPHNPAKNPHPVKRYEVIATADAPGPWDSVKGMVFFDVINRDCVPRAPLTGAQNVPNIGIDIEMSRLDEKTWRGYFYKDALNDENYFGLGACHWGATSIGVSFIVRGEAFKSGFWLEDFNKGPQVNYFKKNDYGDPKFVRYGAPDYSDKRPEYIREPDAFFPITMTIKEIGL